MSHRTQLIVELDARSDPVQGKIGRSDEAGRPFSGYVQLIAALEGFRTEDGVGEEQGDADGYRGERAGAAS